MTRHFMDDDGRRWKAWLASRGVYWPEPDEPELKPDHEAVIFVCFSDASQPQRRSVDGGLEGPASGGWLGQRAQLRPEPSAWRLDK